MLPTRSRAQLGNTSFPASHVLVQAKSAVSLRRSPRHLLHRAISPNFCSRAERGSHDEFSCSKHRPSDLSSCRAENSRLVTSDSVKVGRVSCQHLEKKSNDAAHQTPARTIHVRGLSTPHRLAVRRNTPLSSYVDDTQSILIEFNESYARNLGRASSSKTLISARILNRSSANRMRHFAP